MYKLINDSNVVQRIADEAFIPDEPLNRDRQEYDAWVAAGNKAQPADPAPVQDAVLGVNDIVALLIEKNIISAADVTAERVGKSEFKPVV